MSEPLGPALKLVATAERTVKITSYTVVAIDQHTGQERILFTMDCPDGQAVDIAYRMAREQGIEPAGHTIDINALMM